MADEPQWDVSEQPLSAEEVAASSFPTAFRGFDPVEVRAFLARVADELRAAAAREAELREVVASAAADVAAAATPAQAEVDAARAETERLAAELADAEARLADQEDRARLREADAAEQAERTLAAAKSEAARRTAEARDEANRTLRDAREEAARLGSEADRILAQAKEGAAVAGIEERKDAERDAAVIRVKAREEADAIIEAAKERGREMVGEAQAARERMLKDLARRRRTAQAQVEHLKEARDRVLEHLRFAGRTVEEITSRFEPADEGWSLPPTGSQQRTEASRPQIAALQAEAAVVLRPPDEPASAREPPKPEPSLDTEATPAGEAPVAAPPPDDVRPTREERKSSALRILRRGRPQPEPEVAASAAEPVEGVRLIGPPPRVFPSDQPEEGVDVGEPGGAGDAGDAGEPPDDIDASDAVPDEFSDELAEVEVEVAAADATARADTEVDADAEVAIEPETDAPQTDTQAEVETVEVVEGERETVRPGETLDELFARLRAGREHAVAAAPRGDEEEPRVADDDERALQRRDVAVEETEATMARRLKRALQDEHNAALDALRTRRGVPTLETLVGTPEVHQQRFRRLAATILAQAAAAGAAPAERPTAVDDLVEAFAAEVAGALRDRLDRALAQNDEEGGEPGALSERLNAVYRDFKGQRSERLSAHFVIAANARGAFEASAEDASFRWVVDDGGPCPDCDDNALAGVVPKGAPYPTGQLHPPAHVGCRCVLVAAHGG